MPYFGVHESINGGFAAAVQRISANGFDAIQIFSGNASRWENKSISPEDAQEFQKALREEKIEHTLIHDSYLINIASVDPEKLARSQSRFTDELLRAELLGVPYLVMHPGSFKDDARENGVARASQSFDTIFQALPSSNQVTVLVEITAGQGSYLGSTFEEIAAIINGSAYASRLGVCFDTCHAFASGYDFLTRDAYLRVMDDFDKVLGLDKLMAFHLNDSMKGLASHVDRHTHIGLGALGLEPFRLIVNDPRFKDTPMYLETPKGENENGEDWDKVNLATLRALLQ
ncbi:MAG: deoxyribonuclease IV [Planctomycetia bacterium]|nr:deoxyribonuclease IV [Planctomycetia bacterium]